ncbi:MAG: rhodanese-like domain-containing protein [Planctomycetota bacterium]
MSLPIGQDSEWEVTPEEVVAMRQGGRCDLLLDVRTPDEIATAAIDGAEEIPMQVLAVRVGEIETFKDRKVVVFCHGGVRSLKVTEYLRGQGFGDAWSMHGGIDAWSQRIDPSVPRY